MTTPTTLSYQTQLPKIIAKYRGHSEELIPILQETQAEFGFLPQEALLAIARFLKMPESKVYGVATFYSQFRLAPIGKQHVCVCRGTACHVQGAKRLLEEIEQHLEVKEGTTTADGNYSLETVGCIGCCGLAPCVTVNGKVVAKVTPQKIPHLLPKEGA
jgi:NADH-quinone oxidoreductase subunit E